MKATVGEHDFHVDLKADAIVVNGNEERLDILPMGRENFHVLRRGRTFGVEIVERNGKTIVLKINGKMCVVTLSDRMDELLQKLGIESKSHAAVESLKAPMPGLVVSVRVDAGGVVVKGDALVVLEAMKMENVLKAHGDAQVKAVHVRQGQAVEKGQVLMDFAT